MKSRLFLAIKEAGKLACVMWFGGVVRIYCHGDDRLIKLDGVKLQSEKASAQTTDSQIEGDMS